MDRRGNRQLSESDIRMMETRSFVVGRLSAGEATFEDIVDAATNRLGVSIGTARGAIWTLADVGVVNGVTSEKLSLAVPQAPAPTSTPLVETPQ